MGLVVGTVAASAAASGASFLQPTKTDSQAPSSLHRGEMSKSLRRVLLDSDVANTPRVYLWTCRPRWVPLGICGGCNVS